MQANVRPIKPELDMALVSQSEERGPMDEPGFRFTRIGLDILPGIKFENWEKFGRKLQLAERGIQWAIGDWLNYGEQNYGDMYTQAVELTGYAEQTLMNYKAVAKAFKETSRRRENVDFSTHAEVVGLPEDAADRILAQAEADPRVSRDIVRKEAQRAKRKLNKNPSEIEVLHEPAVRDFLTTYVDSLKDWEKIIPSSAPFLRNMLHAHIGQALWQIERTVEGDCNVIYEAVEAVDGITDDELFTALQDKGYFMRDPEIDDRIEMMVEKKRVKWIKMGGRKDDQRGDMTEILVPYGRPIFD